MAVRQSAKCNNLILFTANDKYRAGYTDCAREVAKYLSMPEPPPSPNVTALGDNGCKARLLRHLDQCILEIDTEIGPASIGATTPSSSSSAVVNNQPTISVPLSLSSQSSATGGMMPHATIAAAAVNANAQSGSGATLGAGAEHLSRPQSAFVGVRKK